MKIVLISDDKVPSEELEEALADEGHEISVKAALSDALTKQLKLMDVELMLLNVEQLDEDGVKRLRQVASEQALPIIIFAKKEGSVQVGEVVRSGVSAYVLDGLKRQRVKPVLEVALARFKQFQFLQDEVVSAKQALQERKDVERAKGILMKQKKLTEDDAYKVLRKAAMDQNKRLAEVAKNIIGLADMIG